MDQQARKRKGRRGGQTYAGWSLRQRLPLAILGGLALPFTIFVGVFEIYAQNLTEFKFVWGDFAPLLILICVGAALVLGGILLALRGRVFDVAFALLFSVAFMACVQSLFLNFGINSLSGDGLGMTVNPVWAVFNLIIWLLMIAGAVVAVLLLRQRDLVRTVSLVALVVLIGMQIPSLITVALTTDVFAPKDTAQEMMGESETGAEASSEPSSEETQDTAGSDVGDGEDETTDPDAPLVLTTENLYTVGSEKNVIVFLVDRFDIRYVDEIKAHDPTFLEQFEDFVYYEDNITTYSRTYPAVGSILSGMENKFEKGVSAADYFQNAYQNSPLLNELRNADYSINIYTDDYYAYRDAREFLGFADNISGIKDYAVKNVGGLCADMLRLSAYRYVPVAAKSVFDVSTDAFEQYVVYETEYPMYNLNDAEIYAALDEDGLTVGEHKNSFAFIHLWGIHPPYRIDADGGSSKSQTSLGATLGCMNLVLRYIEELKALGLYEDATIIITGDHPDPISDDVPPDQPRLTALFVKRAGDSGKPFSESRAQVSQQNLIPSILESTGVDVNRDFGTSYWEVPEGEDQVRHYNFIVNSQPAGKEYIVRYVISGDGRDFSNWEIEDEFSLNGWFYR